MGGSKKEGEPKIFEVWWGIKKRGESRRFWNFSSKVFHLIESFKGSNLSFSANSKIFRKREKLTLI